MKAVVLAVLLALCGVTSAFADNPAPQLPWQQPQQPTVAGVPMPMPDTPADAAAASAAPAQAHTSTKEDTFFAIKVIGGLLALMVLAYLGGHRKVVQFQERLGIGGVITAGFPFVALGAIAASDAVGVLTPGVLVQLRPVLHFGLGWLGFIIGAQLDIRVLDRVPKGTAYLILVEALGPFAITAAGCGLMMVTFGSSLSKPSTTRS